MNIPATTLVEVGLTARSVFVVKAEGKMRNLYRDQHFRKYIFPPLSLYPIIIMKVDITADTFQYHCVRSFSLYRSINVRRGLHLGSGIEFRAGLRAGLRNGLLIGLRILSLDPSANTVFWNDESTGQVVRANRTL